MPSAISTLSIVPVRKEPSDRSEMITQILFGETMQILQPGDKWSRIRLLHDGYEGWADTKQITPLSDDETQELAAAPAAITRDNIGQITCEDAQFPVLLGSLLPLYQHPAFRIGNKKYTYTGEQLPEKPLHINAMLIQAARCLHAPYLWGGRTPFGYDCSGFTQIMFRLCGIQLLRDAYQQAEQGTPVPSLARAQAADLAFFSNEEGRVVHVGILMPGEQIIHASGRVRIDKITPEGILNKNTNRITHRLTSIRNLSAPINH